MKVCKFGGTSMASTATIRRVGEIVRSDPARRFIVVSAPGRRTADDTKITDLLFCAHAHAAAGLSFEDELGAVFSRFSEIADGLHIDLASEFAAIRAAVAGGASADYCASRGEYLAAKALAAHLDVPMIDAAELVRFSADGTPDYDATYAAAAQALARVGRAVIPGFYGAAPDGSVRTFSRGGSDVSGALIARAVGASVYENWTDVGGFLACDPRIVHAPTRMRIVSCREARELASMGAGVLHPDAIPPVAAVGIPINIRNTFDPDDCGTTIVPTERRDALVRAVSGIAGKKNYLAIRIEKPMNAAPGFLRRALTVLERFGLSAEHVPCGVDAVMLVLDAARLDDAALGAVVGALRRSLGTDRIRVERRLALIAAVGQGLSDRVGAFGTLFRALDDAGIDVRMIDRGASQTAVVIAVGEQAFAPALHAIYRAFLPPGPQPNVCT